jgi:hypothetical protein
MELVPITPSSLAQTSTAVVNVGASALAASCPTASTQPALCGMFRNLAANRVVTWPLAVPAHSAMILYTQDQSLIDSDSDGIADSQDLCPGTDAGAAVNASGCSFTQRRPDKTKRRPLPNVSRSSTEMDTLRATL